MVGFARSYQSRNHYGSRKISAADDADEICVIRGNWGRTPNSCTSELRVRPPNFRLGIVTICRGKPGLECRVFRGFDLGVMFGYSQRHPGLRFHMDERSAIAVFTFGAPVIIALIYALILRHQDTRRRRGRTDSDVRP